MEWMRWLGNIDTYRGSIYHGSCIKYIRVLLDADGVFVLCVQMKNGMRDGLGDGI